MVIVLYSKFFSKEISNEDGIRGKIVKGLLLNEEQEAFVMLYLRVQMMLCQPLNHTI